MGIVHILIVILALGHTTKTARCVFMVAAHVMVGPIMKKGLALCVTEPMSALTATERA